jgi:hypothetical protein
LWVSIVLKLLLPCHFYSSSFFHFIDFSFQCFQNFDGFLSLFISTFQFVINVFNSMLLMCFLRVIVLWFFQFIYIYIYIYLFIYIYWCFPWGVFKLSTLCFCVSAFIFGISTFNIWCFILQIFVLSSIFYF